jgi:hypothetical protein
MGLPPNLLRIARQRASKTLRRKMRSSSADSNSQWVISCQFSGGTCGVITPQAPGSQVATLSGLTNPQGVVAGVFSGYWYVANTDASDIPYYASDSAGNPFPVYGTAVLPNPLEDTNQYPADLALNETADSTGLLTASQLAVSNIYSTSFGPGSVTVFTTSGSSYSSYNLSDPNAYEGEGVAFDNGGNCFWAYNSEEAEGPGRIDEFASCQGDPQQVAGIAIGFAGGVAFDNNGNLWYVDQEGQSNSLPAGVYKCNRLSSCKLVFGGFTDPLFISFDTANANVYVSDVGAGIIYQCSIGSSSCVQLYASGYSNPPYGVAVDSVQAASDIDPSYSYEPQGPLTPQDFWNAYKLGNKGPEGGEGKIVAVVEAGPNGTVASDMATFRANNHLNPAPPATPPPLTVYNQAGAVVNPSGVAGAINHSSGVTQMVAANCPKCSIALIEANTWDIRDLYQAFTVAKTKATGSINNSYAYCETALFLKATERKEDKRVFVYEPFLKTHSFRADVPVTAASGNQGYGICPGRSGRLVTGVSAPASSADVIAVGGTVLTNTPSGTRAWSERVAGLVTSGCSVVTPRPAWQPIGTWSQCGTRAARNVGDIGFAAVNIGVVIAGTARSKSGTSYASPSIAALYAASKSRAKNASPLYTEGVMKTIGTFGIGTGNNGACGNYLCDATKSIMFPGQNPPNKNLYNGPTGWGTPNGLTIFKL